MKALLKNTLDRMRRTAHPRESGYWRARANPTACIPGSPRRRWRSRPSEHREASEQRAGITSMTRSLCSEGSRTPIVIPGEPTCETRDPDFRATISVEVWVPALRNRARELSPSGMTGVVRPTGQAPRSECWVFANARPQPTSDDVHSTRTTYYDAVAGKPNNPVGRLSPAASKKQSKISSKIRSISTVSRLHIAPDHSTFST
jgi:hypothetical protein